MTGKRDRDPPNARTPIIRLTAGSGTPITDAEEAGSTTDLVYWDAVPYLGKASLNDHVFYIVPLAAGLDPQVNLTMSTTVAITVVVLGDTSLYEESTFSNGPARAVWTSTPGLLVPPGAMDQCQRGQVGSRGGDFLEAGRFHEHCPEPVVGDSPVTFTHQQSRQTQLT